MLAFIQSAALDLRNLYPRSPRSPLRCPPQQTFNENLFASSVHATLSNPLAHISSSSPPSHESSCWSLRRSFWHNSPHSQRLSTYSAMYPPLHHLRRLLPPCTLLSYHGSSLNVSSGTNLPVDWSNTAVPRPSSSSSGWQFGRRALQIRSHIAYRATLCSVSQSSTKGTTSLHQVIGYVFLLYPLSSSFPRYLFLRWYFSLLLFPSSQSSLFWYILAEIIGDTD